jgi:hypothetical protein
MFLYTTSSKYLPIRENRIAFICLGPVELMLGRELANFYRRRLSSVKTRPTFAPGIINFCRPSLC